MEYKIRFAEKKDINQVIKLCEAHSSFENCEYKKQNKSEKLLELFFSKEPKIYCLVVENELQIIGYATYTIQYSTWEAEKYMYLDCLYLDEYFRGENIGEKLIKKIKEESQKLGCKLIQWQTPKENKRAIKFYNRIGGKSQNKERFFLKINQK